MAKVVKAIHESSRGTSGVGAFTDMFQIFLHSHCHALVKNETFSKPMSVPVFLLVIYNPTVQLKNLLKSTMPK